MRSFYMGRLDWDAIYEGVCQKLYRREYNMSLEFK